MPVRSILMWGIIGLVLVVFFGALSGGNNARRNAEELTYSDFIQHIEAGDVESVTTQGSIILVRQREREMNYVVNVPEGAMPDTVRRLIDANVRVKAERPKQGPGLGDILLGILPMLLLIGAWFFFLRQMQTKAKGGGNIVDG